MTESEWWVTRPPIPGPSTGGVRFGDAPPPGDTEIETARRRLRRRRARHAGVALTSILVIVGSVVVGVRSLSRPPALELVVADVTVRNPLPDEFHVAVDDRSVSLRLRNDRAEFVERSGFSDGDSTSVEVFVPERIRFKVPSSTPQNRDGAISVLVRITDDAVELQGLDGRWESANPVAEAEEAARRATAAEHARVVTELELVDVQIQGALDRYNKIWDGRDTAPYVEIQPVFAGEILPAVDAAIAHLDAIVTGDVPSQQAIAAQKSCALGLRAAYDRNSYFGPNLSKEDNDAQQAAAWSATKAACDEAANKRLPIS